MKEEEKSVHANLRIDDRGTMRKSRRAKKRQKQQTNNSFKEKLSGTLDLPIETLSNYAQIQILENKEIIVEGYKGILEYDDNMIRVKTKNMQLSFWGNCLMLRCMNDDNIIINGNLEKIEFNIV